MKNLRPFICLDGGANDEQLKAVEDSHGVKLPTDYVEFLKSFNGGYPEDGLVVRSGQEIFIQYIYGVSEEVLDCLDGFPNRLSGGLLPIGLGGRRLLYFGV